MEEDVICVCVCALHNQLLIHFDAADLVWMAF